MNESKRYTQPDESIVKQFHQSSELKTIGQGLFTIELFVVFLSMIPGWIVSNLPTATTLMTLWLPLAILLGGSLLNLLIGIKAVHRAVKRYYTQATPWIKAQLKQHYAFLND